MNEYTTNVCVCLCKCKCINSKKLKTVCLCNLIVNTLIILYFFIVRYNSIYYITLEFHVDLKRKCKLISNQAKLATNT